MPLMAFLPHYAAGSLSNLKPAIWLRLSLRLNTTSWPEMTNRLLMLLLSCARDARNRASLVVDRRVVQARSALPSSVPVIARISDRVFATGTRGLYATLEPGSAYVLLPVRRLREPNTFLRKHYVSFVPRGCNWGLLSLWPAKQRCSVVAGSSVSDDCPAMQGHLYADCAGMQCRVAADLARIGAFVPYSRSLAGRWET
jgi:hypothetical protein